MVTSATERRTARRKRATDVFGRRAEAALDLLAVLDLAWHDCYGESFPPDPIIEDIWLTSNGDLGKLISASHLAVTDFRDLRVIADDLRSLP